MSGRDRAGHSRGIKEDADSKRLGIARASIVAFIAVEVVVGILVHLLTSLSDAAHILTDAGALTMSLKRSHGLAL